MFKKYHGEPIEDPMRPIDDRSESAGVAFYGVSTLFGSFSLLLKVFGATQKANIFGLKTRVRAQKWVSMR